jgi:hypothetical protein
LVPKVHKGTSCRQEPTLNELLDPTAELESGDSEFQFERRDEVIVERVQNEEAVGHGVIIDVDSNSEENNEPAHLNIREKAQLYDQET